MALFVLESNVAPTVATSAGSTTFTEGANTASTPVAVDPDLTVSDTDSPNLTGATVTIGSGFQSAEDQLLFTDTDEIAGDYDATTGVLTLTGTATVAEYQAALRSVTYSNSSDTPNTTDRRITFVVTDDDGFLSTDAIRTVTVAAADDGAIFSGLDNEPTYVEDGGRVQLDPDVVIVDPEADPVVTEGAVLTLTRAGGASAEDVFDSPRFEEGQVYVAEPDEVGSLIPILVGSYTQDGGTLTVTFGPDATLDRVNTVLQSINYANGSDAPPPSIVVDYSFSNGETATGQITVNITASNDAPQLEVAPTGAYAAGDAPVVLSESLTLSDADSTQLVGATVSVLPRTLPPTDGSPPPDEPPLPVSPDDVLAANTSGTTIVADYDEATGVLTLTGAASLEDYRQVLSTVTYGSSATEPTEDGPTRLVTFTVDDGETTSSGSTTIYFAPTADLDADATGVGYSTTFAESGEPVPVVDSDVALTPGTYGLTGASVTLTNAATGDVLAAGTLPDGITATVDESTPGRITLLLSGSASAEDYESALRAVTYENTSDDPESEAREIVVTVTDGNLSSAGATTAVTVETDDAVNFAFEELSAEEAASEFSYERGDNIIFTDADLTPSEVLTSRDASSIRFEVPSEDGGEPTVRSIAVPNTDPFTAYFNAVDFEDRESFNTEEASVEGGQNYGEVYVGADAGAAVNDDYVGTSFQDRADGYGGNDTLDGAGGDDLLNGDAGDDDLFGGEGNDRGFGGAGNDTLYGDNGDDLLQGNAGNDIEDGGNGNDTVRGGAGDDTLSGNDGDDQVFGDNGIDTLNGGLGNDTLFGGNNDDTIIGGDGDDQLSGNDGVDQLYGETGADRLFGGAGDDFVSGDNGASTLR